MMTDRHFYMSSHIIQCFSITSDAIFNSKGMNTPNSQECSLLKGIKIITITGVLQVRYSSGCIRTQIA